MIPLVSVMHILWLNNTNPDFVTLGFPLRFGAVEAVTTPSAVELDRASGHFSLVADEIRHDETSSPHDNIASAKDESPSEEPQRITSQASLAPPSASDDPLRSSYMTSTTEGSRMSGLSDFPAPPVQTLTPAHMSIIHSYFGGNTPQKQAEDPLSSNEATQSESRRHASYRMTFGGSEDTEDIAQGIPKDPEP